MSRTTTTRAVRRGVAGVGALALTATGLGTVLVGPAVAATGNQTFVCSVEGTDRNFTLNLDTDLPAKVTAGSTTTNTLTQAFSVPRGAFGDLVTANPATSATSVTGTITARAGVEGDGTPYRLPLASTALPPTGDLTGSAAGQAQFAAPAQGNQDVAVNARNQVWDLSFRNAAGTQVATRSFTCAAPTPLVAIDTVAIASTSATTVALSRPGTKYGKPVNATATVTTAQGKPAGQVEFKVGDKSVLAALDATGKATVELPLVGKGTYPVTATFKPTDALRFDESVSVAASLKVKKDSAKSDLTVVDKRSARRVVAKNTVRTGQGTKAEGKIEFVLRRFGKLVSKAQKNANAKGKATYWFRNVRATGNYKVTTKYLGSANLRTSKDTSTFVIR